MPAAHLAVYCLNPLLPAQVETSSVKERSESSSEQDAPRIVVAPRFSIRRKWRPTHQSRTSINFALSVYRQDQSRTEGCGIRLQLRG